MPGNGFSRFTCLMISLIAELVNSAQIDFSPGAPGRAIFSDAVESAGQEIRQNPGSRGVEEIERMEANIDNRRLTPAEP